MKETKFERLRAIIHSLEFHGFTREEAYRLIRQNSRLYTWGERECNGEIEHKDETGRPHASYDHHTGRKLSKLPIPDTEKGAVTICHRIVAERNKRVLVRDDQQPVTFYYQTDPRGVQVYIVRQSDVPHGGDIASYYSRGIAVYRP